MTDAPPRLRLLLGPTATGKTRLAVALAERGYLGPLAVVSCDSMQVYRHLDIGTAKPTPTERDAVPHHLIDVVEPDQPFNAGEYVRLADEAIAAERDRGRTPLVVGGTGLYVRALLHGLAEVPPVPDDVRDRIARKVTEDGLPALHERLRQVDPELARRLTPGDTQRITRGLEVYEATGRPLSAIQAEHRFKEARYKGLLLVLDVPREELYRRIERRVDEMLESGLVEEVRALLDRGVHPRCKPLRAPGYREVVAHVRGELTREQAREQIQRAHRRYAKRQLTWFRGLPDAMWVDPADVETVEHLLQSC